MLSDVVLMGADTARCRAYIDLLHRAGLEPAAAVLVDTGARSAQGTPTPLFDNITPAPAAATRAGIPVQIVPAQDINDPAVCAALTSLPQPIVIFCGPGGAIVRAPLFATGKRFLHMHPGRLPDYRGSTTMYYSLLTEGRIAVSALFLDPRIDAGPVVAMKDFEPPSDRTLLDHVFDPYIRARLLVEVLDGYRSTGRFPERRQSPDEGTTFYIIHPVLKHLAILSRMPASGTGDRA